MRRLIITLLAGAMICSTAILSQATAAPRDKTLKIYNWADYMDESLLAEFEVWYKEQTGEDVKIIYQTYDMTEVALAKVERAKADYDLICPTDYIVDKMLRKDLLLPIDKDFGSTPNYLGNVSPYISERLDIISSPGKEVSDYAIPYMWNTTGILYNTSALTREEAESWNILWDSRFKGRILMKDDSRHIYGIMRLLLNEERIEAGESAAAIVNYSSDEDIAQVEAALVEVRENVAGFEMDFGKETMAQGKCDVSIQYLADALWARDEAEAMGNNVGLDYVIPKEGSVMFIDTWVIPKYAQNVKAASYFINFMCRHQSAVRNMEYVGYIPAVPAPELLELVRDESLETLSDLSYFFGEGAEQVPCDPLRFVSYEDVSRCYVMCDFGDDVEKIMVMWATVKGDNLSVEMVMVIVVTALLALGLYLRKLFGGR